MMSSDSEDSIQKRFRAKTGTPKDTCVASREINKLRPEFRTQPGTVIRCARNGWIQKWVGLWATELRSDTMRASRTKTSTRWDEADSIASFVRLWMMTYERKERNEMTCPSFRRPRGCTTQHRDDKSSGISVATAMTRNTIRASCCGPIKRHSNCNSTQTCKCNHRASIVSQLSEHNRSGV